MKKIKWVILCTSILSICIVVALLMRDKHEVSTYLIEGENVMYELRAEQIEEELLINTDLLDNYRVMFSVFENLSEKIFILRVKQGKMDEVKQLVDSYIQTLQYSESQMELIDNCIIYEKEDVFMLVISNEAQTIVDELKVRLDE